MPQLAVERASADSKGAGLDAQAQKKKAVLERIASLEDKIGRAQAYLETGAHAEWSGFEPCFVSKRRDGKFVPPHKGWVRSTFLPRRLKALRRAEKALERLERARRPRRSR